MLFRYYNKFDGDKMLNLKECKAMNKQVNDYYYLFNIEAKDKPTVCPMCNAVDVEFKKHSSRERELSDALNKNN